MNNRQAKKRIKRKWGIKTYTFPYEPKKVDRVYSYIVNEVKKRVVIEIEKEILFGADMRQTLDIHFKDALDALKKL